MFLETSSFHIRFRPISVRFIRFIPVPTVPRSAGFSTVRAQAGSVQTVHTVQPRFGSYGSPVQRVPFRRFAARFDSHPIRFTRFDSIPMLPETKCFQLEYVKLKIDLSLDNDS